MLGVPLLSILKRSVLFALNLNDLLSVVPMKFVTAVIPLLPVKLHAEPPIKSLTVRFLTTPDADVNILSVDAPVASVESVKASDNVLAPAIVCVPVLIQPLSVADA